MKVHRERVHIPKHLKEHPLIPGMEEGTRRPEPDGSFPQKKRIVSYGRSPHKKGKCCG